MDIQVNSENEIVATEQVQQSKTLNKMNLSDQKNSIEMQIRQLQANLDKVNADLATFDSPDVVAAVKVYTDAQAAILAEAAAKKAADESARLAAEEAAKQAAQNQPVEPNP